MSRSGYTEDCDDNEDQALANLWRAAVERAIGGKRGQAFLREMAAALDAMPVKELITGDIVRGGQVCAIGSVALARNLDVSGLDVEDSAAVGRRFGISRAMACEIAFENDERDEIRVLRYGPANKETPAERWNRMRAWVRAHLREAE